MSCHNNYDEMITNLKKYNPAWGGKMNFFNLLKKKPKKTVVQSKTNRLRVYFKDSVMDEWWVDDYTSDDIIVPWKDFIKWYFRENSKEYLFKSKNAIQLIKKEDIRKFMIDIIEVEK